MKKLNALFLACLAAGTFVSTQLEAAAANNTVVRFHFTYGTFKLGDVDVELFDQDKPLTVSNFLARVQNGTYDNGIIHRCDPDFVIQGGLYSVDNPYSNEEIAVLRPIPDVDPIPDEYNVGPQYSNTMGTLAMALSSLDDGTAVPNSGTASWFFNIDDNSIYLTNYTVFGRVKAGLQYLQFFKGFRQGGRIIDMFSPTYQCGLLTIDDQTDVALDELPVAYLVDCPYYYSDLFAVQIYVLNPADTVPPSVTLAYPTKNLIVSNGTITATGTVTDAVGLGQVRVYLEPGTNGPIEATIMNKTWSAEVALPPGTNRIVVEATDASGNRATAQAQFFYSARTPITLSLAGTSGAGTVTPIANGQLLEVSRWYTMTATPAPGNLFAGWTIASLPLVFRQPTLLFQMSSNLAVTAIFNSNHFSEVKGTYTGLFYQTNLVEEQSSGFITLTVGDRGSYSAKMMLEGKTYRMTGAFDSGTGESFPKNSLLVRNGSNDITVNLTLDLGLGTDRLTGDLSVNTNSMTDVWTATLNADRNVFNARTNPAPFAGKYTMIFPSTNVSPTEPGGDGYGTVSITTSGAVSFRGELADGTRVTQRVPLSKNGEWPLFLSPYRGKGSLLSWVAFDTNQPTTDLSGRFYWFKQTQLAKCYPDGFTNVSLIAGSHFTPPTTTNRLLEVTNVVVGFTNGHLTAEFANNAMLDAAGKVTDLDLTNKFRMAISRASGSFSGSAMPPGAAKAIALKGVVLQKTTNGFGFFLNTNQSGRVSIGP